MLVKTGRSLFDALLKLEDGEVIAHGTAAVDIPGRAVTFQSDFVPLYPIGTPMEIVRIYQGREIHRFTGKVYLSDKALMRLISVEDELLPGSELFYCDGMEFTAMLTLCAPPKKRFTFRLRKRKKEPEMPTQFSVCITEMTDRQLVLKIETDLVLEAGARFELLPDLPLPISGAIIRITEPMLFGPEVSYICEFEALPPETLQRHARFLWELNLLTNKLF